MQSYDASLRSDEAANLIEIGALVVGYGEGGKARPDVGS